MNSPIILDSSAWSQQRTARSTIRVQFNLMPTVKRSLIAPGLLAFAACCCSGQVVDLPIDREVRLEISRSAHRVTLYRGDRVIRSYPVAVGRAGWETPEGNFHVYQKVRDPIWEHPLTREVFRSGERGNELGHYWIGFWSDGNIAIGFHGTPHPETVGKALSHGCVRMFAKDIGELFGQVSIGTLVSVVP